MEVILNTDELFLAQTDGAYTAFRISSENNHVATLKKLWFWAEQKQQNTNDLKIKLLLAKEIMDSSHGTEQY